MCNISPVLLALVAFFACAVILKKWRGILFLLVVACCSLVMAYTSFYLFFCFGGAFALSQVKYTTLRGYCQPFFTIFFKSYQKFFRHAKTAINGNKNHGNINIYINAYSLLKSTTRAHNAHAHIYTHTTHAHTVNIDY